MKTRKSSHQIGLVSLGCAKNLVDSEVLLRQLEANHFSFVHDPVDFSGIDTAIVNTCGFIGDAKQESINTILQFINAKKHGLIDHVYVMGCLSERYRDELIKELPEVDSVFGVNDLKKIIEHLGGKYRENLVGERRLTTPGHYAYLKIAEGCDRHCSFCAIPSIRGSHRSRPVEDILREAKELVGRGVKEINVISQDTTYYGLDLYKKRRIAELLESLAGIEGLEWIRLHYTYPDGFPEHLLDVINDHPNICNYIDIPLQHISDRILRSMKRGMDGRSTRELVEKIRKKLPQAAIRTTFITGYPGETQKEFKELVDFIQSSRFDRLGVFGYSHEEGTAAFSLEDNITAAKKRQRVEQIMSIQETISYELNQNRIGSHLRMIVDREEGEFLVGRSEFDSPEVDNEILVAKTGSELKPGMMTTVEIYRAESFDLHGKLL